VKLEEPLRFARSLVWRADAVTRPLLLSPVRQKHRLDGVSHGALRLAAAAYGDRADGIAQCSTAQMSVVFPVRLRRVNWNVARSTAMSSRPTTSVVEGPAGMSVGK
jgi:hypothetical protein